MSSGLEPYRSSFIISCQADGGALNLREKEGGEIYVQYHAIIRSQFSFDRFSSQPHLPSYKKRSSPYFISKPSHIPTISQSHSLYPRERYELIFPRISFPPSPPPPARFFPNARGKVEIFPPPRFSVCTFLIPGPSAASSSCFSGSSGSMKSGKAGPGV